MAGAVVVVLDRAGAAVRLLADLGDEELRDAIIADTRRLSRTQADRFAKINEFAHRRAGETICELTFKPPTGSRALSIAARAVAAELAVELTLTTSQAEKLTYDAVGFNLEAPATLDALHTGAIDLPRAEAILDAVRSLIDVNRPRFCAARLLVAHRVVGSCCEV